jgi:hypothetical protein
MGEPTRLLVPVPTLAQVVADPGILARLPADVLVSLRAQLRHLDIDLAAALDRQRLRPVQEPQAPDRAVKVEEAMVLLGMTEDYLYRHWPKLGGYKDDDGHVKFPLTAIQRHIRGRR